MTGKVMSAQDAVGHIKDGATILLAGAASVLEPDAVLAALEQRFLSTGHPRQLTVVHPVMVGDRPGRGCGVFIHPGMLKRIIGGSFVTPRAPELTRMILDGEVEAYNFPIGAISHLIRAIAGGKPGFLTPVGIGTFIDPRVDGAKLNANTREDLVEVMEIDGQEYLFYKAFPVDVAIIRGSVADEDGSISLEDEPATLGVLSMAIAAKRFRGTVIAQVKRLAQRGSLRGHRVKVPGHLVDIVVVHEGQQQTAYKEYDPALVGRVQPPVSLSYKPLPLDVSKVILRRAAFELRAGQLVNIGFGLAQYLPLVAMEEGVFDRLWFSVEQGMVGGVPGGAVHGVFPSAVNPVAILDMPDQFDLYDAGCLDIAFLGLAQIDRDCNVNVSRFGRNLPGCGGFPDITHATRKLVFCGSFTAGGADVRLENGRIRIVADGKHLKLVDKVEHVTLNGTLARRRGQQIMFISERAVLEADADGLVVTEIAPGVDLERDVLAKSQFPLRVSPRLKEMDPRIFQEAPMGLEPEFSRD